MNRKQYLIGNIQGVDADVETSLKEYGLAWIETRTDILFYYGVNHDDENYINFDFCSFDKDVDVIKEFDWVDFDAVCNFLGSTLEEFKTLDITFQITALVNYYGFENIFGSTYWEGLTYQQIMMNW